MSRVPSSACAASAAARPARRPPWPAAVVLGHVAARSFAAGVRASARSRLVSLPVSMPTGQAVAQSPQAAQVSTPR